MRSSLTLATFALVSVLGLADALPAQAPQITKIDPPNWYAGLPPAMLLVRGENLANARFHFSSRSVHIARSSVSANAHWAQIWLSATPTRPLDTTLIAETPQGHASQAYRFFRATPARPTARRAWPAWPART